MIYFLVWWVIGFILCSNIFLHYKKSYHTYDLDVFKSSCMIAFLGPLIIVELFMRD